MDFQNTHDIVNNTKYGIIYYVVSKEEVYLNMNIMNYVLIK